MAYALGYASVQPEAVHGQTILVLAAGYCGDPRNADVHLATRYDSLVARTVSISVFSRMWPGSRPSIRF